MPDQALWWGEHRRRLRRSSALRNQFCSDFRDIKDLDNLVMQARNQFARRARRQHHAVPIVHFQSGQCFLQRRHFGQERQSRPAGGGQRQQLSAPDMLQSYGHRLDTVLNMACEQIIESGRTALVRYAARIDAGSKLQHLARQLRQPAIPGRRPCQLAGTRLGKRD